MPPSRAGSEGKNQHRELRRSGVASWMAWPKGRPFFFTKGLSTSRIVAGRSGREIYCEALPRKGKPFCSVETKSKFIQMSFQELQVEFWKPHTDIKRLFISTLVPPAFPGPKPSTEAGKHFVSRVGKCMERLFRNITILQQFFLELFLYMKTWAHAGSAVTQGKTAHNYSIQNIKHVRHIAFVGVFLAMMVLEPIWILLKLQDLCARIFFPQIATAMGFLLQITMSWLCRLSRQGAGAGCWCWLWCWRWLCAWWRQGAGAGCWCWLWCWCWVL